MKLIKQINSTTCGQACIAMILNTSIEEAIDYLGHGGITSDEEITNAIWHLNNFVEGKPPNDIIALCKHRSPDGTKEHWTISYYGQILDPAMIGKKLWAVYKYLPLTIS